MHRQDFSYHLPEELIAQSPLAERSASRLLVLDGATGGVADRVMGDLPGYLRAGDLLVFNDTRVVAARIVGSKPSGGRVEIFLERAGVLGPGEFNRGAAVPARGECHARVGGSGCATDLAGAGGGGARTGAAEPMGSKELGPSEALVQLRASKPIREGLEITTPGGVVRVLGREDELWRVETPGEALEFFEEWGEVPLPPYIHRAADAQDRERYQSIFAREKGAVAAPTASLHFDAPLIAKLDRMGVGRAFVTLHVGAGTFQPLRSDNLDAHKMHAERVSVSRATWDAIRRTRAAGGRVVAIGTTVVRALESAALEIESETIAPSVVRIGAALQAVGTVGPASSEGSGSGTGEFERKSIGLEIASGASKTGGALGNQARESVVRKREVAAGEARGDPGTPAPAPAAAAALAAAPEASPPKAWSGETRLFIRPGFEFQVVDAMVTNFHLPESTLLMLVSAFAGRENVLAAYAHAIRERYRFFSYGDAMFVTPAKPTMQLSTTRPEGAARP